MSGPLRWWIVAAVAAMTWSSARHADAQVRMPYQLLDDEPDNVYLPPAPPSPEQGTNQGGVHFSLDINSFSTYMFRGIDQSTRPVRNERALQFDGRLTFDLGKLPHPFFGVFSNIFRSDPVSRFEEVRPYGGLEWTIRPITVAGGFNSYIFPNRENNKDTQEVWASISVDDSRFWHTALPVLTPYVYGAYDFNKYDGFYLEGGLRHDMPIGDTGLTLSAVGDFAYVSHNTYFLAPGPLGRTTGFQHYDVGVIANYNMNQLFGVSRRYGEIDLRGMLYYTGSVQTGLRADSRIWGGVGLHFSY